MADRRDPVEEAADGSIDLYDIATWERRTRLDGIAIRIYNGLVKTARLTVILAALIILVAQFALTGMATISNPTIGIFTLLSVVPALAIAIYFWRADITMREPLRALVGTFLLGILFAGFAAILNTFFQPLFSAIPLVGMALFFYLIVAPIEETVKWLAVRLYSYRSESFDAVIDGAVYGAVAGLGFATIENAIYIAQQYLQAIQAGGGGVVGMTLQTAAVRTFAGPGHVIYSAFAGYYLGLAKFNRENAGPIVVKGLLIAAFIHATYNTFVGIVPGLITVFYPSVPSAVAFIGFVIVYDGIFGYALYRKIVRYRHAYTNTQDRRDAQAAATETASNESMEGDETTDATDLDALDEQLTETDTENDEDLLGDLDELTAEDESADESDKSSDDEPRS
ncbi:MAG: PrsW family glutamic-type intramembrane protease [Halobacteriales archaeon]